MEFHEVNVKTPRLPLYQSLLCLACVLILVFNAFGLQHDFESLKETTALMRRTAEVSDRLEYVNVLVMDAESSLRGYFIAGDEAYLGPQREAPDAISRELNQLDTLLADNPSQLRNLQQLRNLIGHKLDNMADAIGVYRQDGLSGIVQRAHMGTGSSVMDEVRLQVVIMVHEQDELLKARTAQFTQAYQRAIWQGIGINVGAIVVLLLFYHLVRRSFYKRAAMERALKDSNENLEATVARRTEQLSVLSRHLIKVAEDEKSRLARELHDEMGANLTAISMDVASVMSRLTPEQEDLREVLLRARAAINQTVTLKRRIIEDLRPSLLDNLGLRAALLSYAEEFAARTGLECDCLIDGDIDGAGPMHAIAIFRIVQEALNNIAKYARARSVIIEVSIDGPELRLQVIDDGIGIDTEALSKSRSHGLLGMRERALLLGGTLDVRPRVRASGTCVSAIIPLAAPEAADAAVKPNSALHP